MDSQAYPAQTLADLYHQRGSIEELYKTVKQTLSMEAFHAQSLRGVQQELIAGMTLIALARMMSNDCETLINGSNHRPTRGGLRANQKNALSVVYNGFEEMMLRFTKSCAPFVRTATNSCTPASPTVCNRIDPTGPLTASPRNPSANGNRPNPPDPRRTNPCPGPCLS